MATGYISSKGLETTSKPMQEILPSKPENWSVGYTFEKFSFYNVNPCNVIINNKFTLTLSAGTGFEIGYEDVPISSFVVVEENTPYEFIGSY